jgi:RHH-type transcriptional regulator, proline utilization regulon repressor / proline dehydrogenase / delta 1-pyrroline-5-carboxylate dehydrogenase
MLLAGSEPSEIELIRARIRAASLAPENEVLKRQLARLEFSHGARVRARSLAANLVIGARARAADRPLVDSFLQEFGLSNQEGIALMCLAEALLRIPDDDTADRLIAEKIAQGEWSSHKGRSESLFVNASTFGLILTGQVIDIPAESRQQPGPWVHRLTRRLGEPVVRAAFRRAMRILGGEFVVGRTMAEAIARARKESGLALCSYDMLGEGARTMTDARRYLSAYESALEAIAQQGTGLAVHARSSLSIKLSALEPRYDLLHRERVLARLVPTLVQLARRAASVGVGLTLDAEEADRLDLSLDVFSALVADPETRPWEGLGIVVQAYGRRAGDIIDWLAALARQHRRRLCVRLVKGAYWDTEIKRAQERGLATYPVFTRKPATDVSYLACAERLFAYAAQLYPQFATHNAYTISAVLQMRPKGTACEFQRLHGMGTLLYQEAQRQVEDFPPIRTYAPVGRHEDLLAYLVRRLLENGANTSFVNRFMDTSVPVEAVVEDPLPIVENYLVHPQPRIPEPEAILGATRVNSRGVDFGNPDTLVTLLQDLVPAPAGLSATSRPKRKSGECRQVRNPADHRELVGEIADATAEEIRLAFDTASAAQHDWDAAGGAERAACLRRAADALYAARPNVARLLVKEAGKTLVDAVAEAREAEDFCRYYASQAEQQFENAILLPGPTGETNSLRFHGRGVFACISPWNFPLAIFMGQVSAALAAGNSVVAKPAEATPLIAAQAIRILHSAGVPAAVLQLTPGAGPAFGGVAFGHQRLSGVALTGSAATALHINRALASRSGAILPLIAETGGFNAMIVDSSALLEQVVDDAIIDHCVSNVLCCVREVMCYASFRNSAGP